MVRDKGFYKTLARIAAPAAFQGFISLLVVQVDNMMVATLGDAALNGVAMSNAATAFFTAIIAGMTSGSSVLISQYWGKKDLTRIRSVYAIVAQIVFTLALVAVAVIITIPSGIVGVFTNAASAIDVGATYIRLVCLSYIPFALSTAIIGMLRGVEVVGITMYTTIAALIINISLNYALIFGRFGFPALGVTGAAIATIISRIVELAIVWWYLFHKQKNLPIKPKHLLRGERLLWIDYLKYGLPVGLTDMQWAFVGLFKTAIIGRLGMTMITANTIATGLMELGRVFSSSLTVGACVMIGMTVGQKDYKKTRKYSNTIQILFVCVGLCIAASVFFFRAPYASLYKAVSPEARELSLTFMWIGALTLIGTTYHASCFVGINRGAGDTKFVMMVDTICGWVVVLPTSYIAAFVVKAPLPVVFLCLYIDQCFKWIVAFIRLRGDKWIRNVTRD